jgi:hypothetical protein
MTDHCCEHQSSACCEPPALVLPPKSNVTERHSRIGVASCCSDGVPVFDGVDPRYKRVLWIVIGINGAMFLTEMIAGQLAGSQALKADALDFLADTVTYGLSLAVIGATLRPLMAAAPSALSSCRGLSILRCATKSSCRFASV